VNRSPRNRKSRPGRSSDRLLYAAGGLLLLACALAMAAIGWYYMNMPSGGVRDPTNGCPADGPSALHIVIIDSTDTLPEPAQMQVATKIMSLARSLGTRPGELLELRTLDLATPVGKILFARCSPSDGTQVSDVTGNPERAKRRWQEEFFGPLEKLTAGGYSVEEADRSPLLETFQALAVERLEPFKQIGRPINLLIVSDMRQYSGEYSHYSGDLSYDRFRGSPAHRKLHTNLGGAMLAILYVQRSQPKIDEGAHIGFWNDWAADNGATLVSVDRLQGEN
jgi:hypothetical protein